ncbi:uncharacterized protein LOC126785832 [Argentina anserina]|uniref:uncharacterized protein LOC126785832 n=1 Tax=Argentina anserina TaxID=57926 RepID=UPI0021768114|nr:uncharacterized protein LOC126785832 [Potentilla anserina]
MSVSSNHGGTTAPLFLELKKQASFFFKEKIKNARLVLTDVTPAQLLTEEATNGNPWAPDSRTLASISRAAFELDDFTRIVEILHNRFLKFERKDWRLSYNSLFVLENLLTHGPESVAAEFEVDKGVIEQMGGFQHIDEKGFNWGLAVRKKSGRILKLLNEGNLLREERDRARKVTRGIQGFGSFCQRTSSAQGILRESSYETYGRSNSDFINREDQESQLPSPSTEDLPEKVEESKQNNESVSINSRKKTENCSYWDTLVAKKPETQTSFKENMVSIKEVSDKWNIEEEFNPLLLGENNDEYRVELCTEDDHPFSDTGNQCTSSLLV